MLYCVHEDVHSQIPPESLSVSLNVVHVCGAQGWFDQYAFDLERGEVARVLSLNSTEIFLRVAVGTGHAGACDQAEHFGHHHPRDRMRQASYVARALLECDAAARDALWREAELLGSRMLSESARIERAKLELA